MLLCTGKVFWIFCLVVYGELVKQVSMPPLFVLRCEKMRNALIARHEAPGSWMLVFFFFRGNMIISKKRLAMSDRV